MLQQIACVKHTCLPGRAVPTGTRPYRVQGRVSRCSCCCVSLARRRSSALPETKLTSPPVIKQVYWPPGSPFSSYNSHSALFISMSSSPSSLSQGAKRSLSWLNTNKCCWLRASPSVGTHAADRKRYLIAIRRPQSHVYACVHKFVCWESKANMHRWWEAHSRGSRQHTHTHTHTHTDYTLHTYVQVCMGEETTFANDVHRFATKVWTLVWTSHLSSLSSLFLPPLSIIYLSL